VSRAGAVILGTPLVPFTGFMWQPRKHMFVWKGQLLSPVEGRVCFFVLFWPGFVETGSHYKPRLTSNIWLSSFVCATMPSSCILILKRKLNI
jgi:hypothetical protein